MRRKPESTLWRSTAAVQKAASDGRAAKLRELRLADEAARREAGVWGELSVYEIVHAPTGAVFVHYWKNTGPNLGKPTRPAGLAAPEFEAYRTWLRQHEGTNFRLAKVAWNLSKAEAMRIKLERIERHKGASLSVINAVESG